MCEIGHQVGLTVPAASGQIAQLHDSGAIRALRTKPDFAAAGRKLVAHIMTNVPPDTCARFCTFTKNNPIITEHHHIIGPYNALLEIHVVDSGELESQLSEIRSFDMSQTAVVLKTYFGRKPPPEQQHSYSLIHLASVLSVNHIFTEELAFFYAPKSFFGHSSSTLSSGVLPSILQARLSRLN